MNNVEPIIGIDLGTTNSEVAIIRDGTVHIVREAGDPMVPSYVGLTPDGKLLVGHEARNQYALYPDHTVRSIKRHMGEDKSFPMGDESYKPQELSAMILGELKRRAERELGQAVQKAVITVPAYFSDAQRQATREAGEIAGLEVVRILNEPTAACLAYEAAHSDNAHTIMAFDLGGGTFDVSIVKADGELVEVIASQGDNHLGGDDFDALLTKELLSRLRQQEGVKGELSEISSRRLTVAAEAAKVALSDAPFARVVEDHLQVGEALVHLDVEIDRHTFEGLIQHLLDKAIAAVHRALKEAKLSARQLDQIILVGGSTRIPAVHDQLQRELGIRPRHDVHPDLAVAMGAGIMAARLMGSEQHRILIDITPYTFGTGALGMLRGVMSRHCYVPIIHAGTPLPVSRSEVFETVQDGQLSVVVTVYQGENQDVRQNILIGTFRVDGLDSEEPAGNELIFHMHLDLDGVLTVTATEKATGLQRQAVIEDSMRAMSDQEMEAARDRVARLYGDEPDEEFEPSLEPIDKTLDDMRQRIAAVGDNLDEVDKEDAARLLARYEEALKAADTQKLDALRQELDDLLFYLET